MISDERLTAREPLAPAGYLNFEIQWLHKDAVWQAYQAAWAAYSKAIRADASGINLSGKACDMQSPSTFRILSTAGMLRGPVLRMSHDGVIGRTIEVAFDWLPGAGCSIEKLEARADRIFSKMYESGALK